MSLEKKEWEIHVGGAWRPFKQEDERLLGEPNTIVRSHHNGKKGGYDRDIQYGDDGRAIRERYYTDHGSPKIHTDPHDHIIKWDEKTGKPNFVKPHINYPDGSVPELKEFERKINMDNKIIGTNSLEENRFKSISDFKWSMKANAEIQFEWKGKDYTIVHPVEGIYICEIGKEETEKICKDADEVLEYKVGEDRLRDVITKVTVWDRTI